MTRKALIFPALALATAFAAFSPASLVPQIQPPPGGGGLKASGTITAGNCAKWATATSLADAGGACGTSTQVYPAAGIANSTGSAWGTSYQAGTAASDLVQLTAAAALPAVSGANLTAIPTVSLTTGVSGILPVANGGTATATPALVAGTGISVSGSWPGQTVTNSSNYAALADPLPIAHGGTGATTLAGASLPVISGTITAGDCVKWVTTTTIGDSGGACGGGGSAEVVWPIYIGSAITGTCDAGNGPCSRVVLVNAHTLVRFTYETTQKPTCTTYPTIGVYDVTASTTLYSYTFVGTEAAGFYDSGALSTAMTAGHTFEIGAIGTAASCTTNLAMKAMNAVYE